MAALGGGHGLFATLRALRALDVDVTAVVTSADDGGSSGRLRAELGIIPPGDLRMALVALMSDGDEGLFWADVLEHRFSGSGAIAGHPVGNLLLAGLCEVLGDPVHALQAMTRRFGAHGRVLPMVPGPVQIEADIAGLEDDPRVVREVQGQVAVASTSGQVRRVRLLPPDPEACADAVAAIEDADMVTLGPGSWFSSVIPHVLVPGQLEALKRTSARRILILNLAPEPGETFGYSPERHLHVLAAHAYGLRIDQVIVDSSAVPTVLERDLVVRAAARLGATVHFGSVGVAGTSRHNPDALADAIREVLYGWPVGTAR